MTPEQLKASILQRAMEGKLVPQNPKDEPASELLKRIKSEKEQLIAEGKIKRDKNETEIFRGDDGLHYEKFADGTVKEIEVPFEIPKSWAWANLKQATLFGNFKSIKGSSIPINSWVLDMEDIEKDTGKILKKVYKSETSVYKSTKYAFSTGDVLYGKLRPYLKKVALADENGYTTTEVFPIKVTKELNSEFLKNILYSPYFNETVNQSVYGVKMPRVGTKFLKKMLIPIPPFNEQIRIVKQINIVEDKIHSYATHYLELKKINQEFPDKLRKSILQYAMQGKLVPQDPNDEPVEVLLEKIRDEKQKLFEEGKLKKKDLQESIIYKGDDNSYYEKKSKKVAEVEIPYEIPDSWKWKTLASVSLLQTGTTPKSNQGLHYNNNDIPFIKPADFNNGELIYNLFLSKLEKEKSRLIKRESVLMVCIGGSRGKTAINKIDVTCNQQINTATPFKNIHFKFLYNVLISPYFQEKMQVEATGTATPIINKTTWGNFLIPIPPYQEQIRITHQIVQFFQIISQLQ